MKTKSYRSIAIWILASIFLIVSSLYLGISAEEKLGKGHALIFMFGSATVAGAIGILIQLLRLANFYDRQMKYLEDSHGRRFEHSIASAEKLFTTITTWAEQMNYEKHPTSSDSYLIYMSKKYALYPIFVAAKREDNSGKLEAWVQFGKQSVPIKPGFSIYASMRAGRDDINNLLARLEEKQLT